MQHRKACYYTGHSVHDSKLLSTIMSTAAGLRHQHGSQLLKIVTRGKARTSTYSLITDATSLSLLF